MENRKTGILKNLQIGKTVFATKGVGGESNPLPGKPAIGFTRPKLATEFITQRAGGRENPSPFPVSPRGGTWEFQGAHSFRENFQGKGSLIGCNSGRGNQGGQGRNYPRPERFPWNPLGRGFGFRNFFPRISGALFQGGFQGKRVWFPWVPWASFPGVVSGP